MIGFENEAKIAEIDDRSEKSLEDSQEFRLYRDSPDRPTLQTIIMYESHLVRCLSSTMAELRRLQKDRRQGLRFVNPEGRGADRAGVCQNVLIEKGSPGGSPSHKSSPMQKLSPTQTESPTRLDSSAADQKNRKDGSPGGSPSQTGSPSQKCSPKRTSTGAEMSIAGGRGADRAGVCQHQQIKDGSPGVSPSQAGSPVQQRSTLQMESPMRTRSGKHRNSATRKHVSSQHDAPIPKTPPLLASITNRRRLEEYTLGEIFEPRSISSTLNFAMIPSK